MSILNDIRAALDTHLAATPGIPAIAQQNVIYSPTTDTPFLKTTLVPTLRRPAVRGLNPQQRYDGLYSILICTPQGLGSGAGYEIADLLLDRFDATTDIVYTNPFDALLLESGDDILLESEDRLLLGSPTFVSIDYSEVGTSYFEPPFYCTPLTVTWYTYKGK